MFLNSLPLHPREYFSSSEGDKNARSRPGGKKAVTMGLVYENSFRGIENLTEFRYRFLYNLNIYPHLGILHLGKKKRTAWGGLRRGGGESCHQRAYPPSHCCWMEKGPKWTKGHLREGGAANPDRQVRGKRFGGRTRRRRETSYMRVGVCRGVEVAGEGFLYSSIVNCILFFWRENVSYK